MQSNAPSYVTDYMSSGMAHIGAANPAQPGASPAPAIGAQQPFLFPTTLTPPIPDDISVSSETEAPDQLCSVRLPVSSASPTQSAWCSISNLLAVAFTPEPGSSTACILIVEPSNAEDVTRLELPMAGPGDWITSLEWSWPGQRRALLSATASGRVVVWTQLSQQRQDDKDDSVFPRCIDDWHGQLLLDVGPLPATATGGGSGAGSTGPNSQQQQAQHPHPQVKQETTGRPGSFGSAAAAGPYIKQEPVGFDPQQQQHSQLSQQQQQQQRRPVLMQPALAGVCWLRQPAAGRSWSTSALAMKRLDPGGQQQGQAGVGPGGGGGGAGGGGGEWPPENFDTLFCDEAPMAGAVPHWARPNQLTAAVLTAHGSLTILWVLASKHPNTLSWYRSKNVRIPPPPEAAAESGGGSDAAAAAASAPTGAASPEWRIASASMCAVHDGSLAAAVVYGRRRDAVYLYGMRGNPTLTGQLVSPQPCTSTAAAGNGAGGGGGSGAPPPTVSLTARLAVPQGMSVRQCRLHLQGGAAARRLYVLACKPSSPSPPPPQGVAQSAWPHPHGQGQNTHPHQAAMVLCYAEATDEKQAAAAAASGGWRLERTRQQLLEPYGGAAAATAAAAASATLEREPSLDLGISVDGSKLVVPYGSWLYTLDSETLAVLAAKDLGAGADPAADGLRPPGGGYGNAYGNGIAASSSPPDAAQPIVLAATGCLSGSSCCLCSVVRLRSYNSDGAATAAAGGLCHGMDLDDDGSGAADDTGDGRGGGGDVVMLSICTVPDVIPPPSGSATAAATAAGGESGASSLERVEDAIACNMDTMRLAWAALHRLSVWDVAERLRCTWLAGRTQHVYRTLDQLDGLLYSTDDLITRISLAQLMTRAKLEVLRRLPHPQAAVLAADLLAGARVLQYSDTLTHVLGASASEAFSHPETRTVAAHMVWFVLEVLTLMLAGLKLWAESVAADKAQQRAAAAAAVAAAAAGEEGGAASAAGAAVGGGGVAACSGAEAAGWLPLIRLFPDYNLFKHMQAVLFGTGHGSNAGKSGPEARMHAFHPAIQELLGGPEVANRARMLMAAVGLINKHLQKALALHTQALAQQQQQPGSATGGGGGGAPSGSLLSGAPVALLSAADVEGVTKSGELPRPLMQRTLRTIFPGPFHLHYSRSKGLITPNLLAQCFLSEEVSKLSPLFALSREALAERYRALGLQQQLMDPRLAPHAAARRLWMSFRAPAPPPELHSHVLTQHVSARQRQRWRRQRGGALALGSSAPLWANAQGTLVDCLTGVPLPPGASWSLEGAASAGAVTAQMGPGVGAAASRRGLPPLLSALQRAWVGCAPPWELGSLWKRARLGLEQDLEY